MSAIIDSFIAPPCHDDIEILWQDEHLLLINKPSGLLSLSGKNPQNLDSVHYRLVQTFPGCTLVHRLDFGTSGLMVVARNKAINAALCQQFSQRSVEKVYSALLYGHLENDEGIIDAPIAKDPALFPLSGGGTFLSGDRSAVNAGGTDAGNRANPPAAHPLPTAGASYSGLRSVWRS